MPSLPILLTGKMPRSILVFESRTIRKANPLNPEFDNHAVWCETLGAQVACGTDLNLKRQGSPDPNVLCAFSLGKCLLQHTLHKEFHCRNFAKYTGVEWVRASFPDIKQPWKGQLSQASRGRDCRVQDYKLARSHWGKRGRKPLEWLGHQRQQGGPGAPAVPGGPGTGRAHREQVPSEDARSAPLSSIPLRREARAPEPSLRRPTPHPRRSGACPPPPRVLYIGLRARAAQMRA